VESIIDIVSGPRVFVSYVRDDAKHIDRLKNGLAKYGIDTWIDKDALQPGDFWKSVIRSVISSEEHFLACFSSAYNSRQSTYMNEELILAIEELRKRPANSRWFVHSGVAVRQYSRYRDWSRQNS
jgi:hypothetical protein